jgi:hypothetical protein
LGLLWGGRFIGIYPQPARQWLQVLHKIKMKKLRFITTMLFLVVSLGDARAKVVPASGEYLFGPETSENEACELARNKAKSLAMSQVVGEKVSSEEQLICNQTTGKSTEYGCEFNRITWSMIDGDIRAVRNEVRKIETREGARACTVSLEADIIEPNKKPDPNFDISVKLNKTVFTVGDDMVLELEGTEPAHLVIFNWLPNQKNEVIRIIPYTNDPNINSLQLLRGDANKISRKFPLEAQWSDAYSKKKKFIDEWLIVIVTKQPYKWLSSYDFEQFKERLREIPIDERRIVRKGYQLTR